MAVGPGGKAQFSADCPVAYELAGAELGPEDFVIRVEHDSVGHSDEGGDTTFTVEVIAGFAQGQDTNRLYSHGVGPEALLSDSSEAARYQEVAGYPRYDGAEDRASHARLVGRKLCTRIMQCTGPEPSTSGDLVCPAVNEGTLARAVADTVSELYGGSGQGE